MPGKSEHDSGETLIESLISLMLVGLAVAAVLGGVASASSLTGDHRAVTTSDIAIKQAAESFKLATYLPGACGTSIIVGCTAAYTVASPTGYNMSVTVRCWSGVPAATVDVAAFPACTVANEHGLQAISITLIDAAGRTPEVTQVLKRQP